MLALAKGGNLSNLLLVKPSSHLHMKPKVHSSSQRSSEGLRSLVQSLATVLLLLTCCSTFAGGLVTDCTEASLRAALAGGGTVTFACDGTIVLSNTLVIASDTVLDATGRSVTLDGNLTNRVLTILTNVSCSITNVWIVRGVHADSGGGIQNSGTLTLQQCVISNNLSGGTFSGVPVRKGGGIQNEGTCNLWNCTLVANRNMFTTSLMTGGAIYNGNSGVVRANGSTFYLNQAGHSGGAIHTSGTGRVGATNCTFNGNFAQSGVDIYQDYLGAAPNRVQLLHCTFSGSLTSPGPFSTGLIAFWVGNSIVPGCVGCAYAGNNLTNTDARLLPLADNGGPTPTMALSPDSPAINLADNALSLPVDQRGVARPFGSAGDIGAFEATVPPAPVVLEFEQANSFVSEGAATATLNVVRRGNAGPNVTVNYAMQAGAALPGFDYVATNGTLTFGFGQTNATILIPIINDTVPEPEEVFTVNLSNATGGAALGAASIHQVRIQDDDPVQRGAFRFQFGSYRVSENGSPIVVNVLRVGGTNGPVSVDFATGGAGNAQPGSDFVATNGTLTFGDTESIKTFTVWLLPDAMNEGAESFSIALSNPAGGATLTNPSVTSVTLNDGVQTLVACDEPSLRAAVALGGKVVLTCDGIIHLTSPLVVSNGVVIDATGHDVTLSGRGSNRIFQVRSGVALELLHLTLADGLAAGTNGSPGQPGGLGAGGAVYLESGLLSATECMFLRNRSLGGAGGSLSGASVGTGGSAMGGAIHAASGQLVLSNCLFSLNKSQGGDAGIGNGLGGNSAGGAIYLDGGTAMLLGCQFITNSVVGGPGSRQSSVGPGQAGSARGGALVNNGATILIKDCSILGNSVRTGTDSAAFTLNVRGGGVEQSTGSLEIQQCLIRGNVAQTGVGGAGGGSYGPSGHAFGGGIYFGGGSLRVTDSTLADNSAIGGRATRGTGQRPGSGFGGGIYSTGSVSLLNCTLAGNQASSGQGSTDFVTGGGYGGGLHQSGGLAELVHVTLAGNGAFGSTPTAPRDGGGIWTAPGMTRLANTLLANSPVGSNTFGVLIDGGGNLSSDGSCNFTAPGSLNNTDPILGPLADYGGPTPTMALLAGSPAIDVGLPANCVATDQRGVARPFGAACDIGAFESAAPYTILGRLTGYVPPAGTATVRSGALTAAVDGTGIYALHGLVPGNHTLKPNSTNAVFLPKTRVVNVIADTLEVDFHSYRTNALVIERQGAGLVRNTFAGEPFAAYSVEVSTSLSNWTYHTAITTDVEGLVTWTETNSPAPAGRFFRARRP